jgi:hypothetical protein
VACISHRSRCSRSRSYSCWYRTGGLHHRRDCQGHICTYLCTSTRLRPTRLTAGAARAAARAAANRRTRRTRRTLAPQSDLLASSLGHDRKRGGYPTGRRTCRNRRSPPSNCHDRPGSRASQRSRCPGTEAAAAGAYGRSRAQALLEDSERPPDQTLASQSPRASAVARAGSCLPKS